MPVPRDGGMQGAGCNAGLGASLPAELSVAALGGGVPPPPPHAEPPQGLWVSHAWEQRAVNHLQALPGCRVVAAGLAVSPALL